MRRSISLGLYLFAARRLFWLFPAAHRKAARRFADVLKDRPEGTIVWMHAVGTARRASLGQLATRMQQERPDLNFVVTLPERHLPETGSAGFPEGTTLCPALPENPALVERFIDHWRPVLCLASEPRLKAALIHATHLRAVPIVLVDAQMTARRLDRWRWFPNAARALLRRPERILAQDISGAERMRALGAPPERLEVTGPLEETTDPLPCNETERDSFAEILRARPVWLAIGATPDEEQAVVAAQRHAMRYSHRLLLILAPADPEAGPAIAQRLNQQGFVTALRSREAEPDVETQIFIADSEGEAGLWYRLAPLTFVGGTLSERGTARNPMEPAALGSAILHGPHLSPYNDTFARLLRARATRQIASVEALAPAVADLVAPDKAAMLAHAAWQVSSSGAEVTERVMRLVFDLIDAGRGRA